jgi:PAS domain S-box-containing protein
VTGEAVRPARRIATGLPWLAALLGAGLLGGVLALQAQTLRNDIDASANRMRILAAGTAEAVARRIEGIEFALTGLAARIDPARLDDLAHATEVHAALVALREVSRDMDAFVVLDRTGRLAATSRVAPDGMEAVSLADQPLFAPIAADPGAGLRISAPYLARLGGLRGKPIIAIGRPLFDGAGAFAGVVTAVLPTSGSRGLLPGMNLPESVTVLAVRRDGVVLEALPTPDGVPETPDPLPRPSELTAAPAPPVAGSFVSEPDADGEVFIAAWHLVDGSEVVVLTGYRRSALVSDWAQVAVPIAFAGAVLAFALLFLAIRLSRTIGRLDTALADLALRARETSAIADALGIGLWVRRRSQAHTEYRGAFAEQLSGKSLALLESEPNAWRKHVVHPDDREGLKASYRGAELTRGWRHEYRVIAADGSVHWVEDRAIQLPDARGDGPVYGAITDVTEIHQTRERLRRRERQIADAVRITGLCFWRLPIGSETAEWTAESYRQFGVDPSTFVPTRAAIRALIEEEDRPKAETALARLEATGEPVEYVYRHRRPDGAVRLRWSRASIERDEAGRMVAIAGVSQDITERQETHAALTQQQLQLAEAGRVAGLGFWRLRKDSDRLEWTDAVYQQMGETPETFTPTLDALYERILPDDRAATREAAERVWRTGEPGSVVYRIRRPDGEIRWRWVSLALERGAGGEAVAISGISQDITEHRLASERLARQERQIAEAGRAARIGFYRRDLADNAITATPEFHAQHGLRPDTRADMEMLRRLVHPDDLAGVEAFASRVIETGETVTLTYRVVRPDGVVRHLRATIGLERGLDGAPAAISGLFQDVTDEVAARERLDRQQRFLDAARRIGHVGFYWRALDSDTYTWTEEIYAGYGVDPASFVPTRAAVRALAHPEDLPLIDAAAARLIETGESGTVTYRIIRPDGQVRWRRATAGLERRPDGVPIGLVGVSQDVTEEVAARDQLERQQRFLEAARRVGKIGFFRRPLDGGPYTWTEEIYRDFGVDPASFTPTFETLMAMIHPDDRAQVDASVRRAIAEGESGSHTYRIIRPDGQIRWRRVASGLERRADGTPVAVVGVAQDVTEEIEARERIAEQARQLSEMGRVARIGFYRRALDGTQMVATAEKLRQFGLPPESGPLDVSVFRDVMHPEDVRRVEAAGRRIVETGESETVTFRVCHPDGAVRWVRIVAGLERGAEGRPIAVTGLSQDVTEEVEAAEQIRQRDKLLADAGRVARLGFWRRRLDEETIIWSDEVYRHFGFEPGSVTPTLAVISERLHPDDVAAWDAALARLRETGDTQTMTVRVRDAEGGYRWIRNSAGLERGSDGVVAVFGITQDLTAEIEARERLIRQQHQLAEAGRVAGLGFWRLPIGGDTFELSDAVYEQSGVARETFHPSVAAVRGMMLEEDGNAVFALMDRVVATGEQSSINYRIRRPDGTIRHRSTTVGLERAPDGTPVALVGVSTDITDRVEQAERLERAQRLNALGELTGGIAHDVNNLLSVIGLNLELLHEQTQPGEAQELTEAALHAVGQGAKLTRGLLAFAQRQSLRPAAVPLEPLAGGLEALLRRALGGRVTLRCEVAPDTPPALADAAQLETSLVNLVLNARDAMPRGGRVTIHAARASVEETLSVGLPPGPHVRLTVADEGEGMPPEVLARAFEPFFTTKGAGKGTGLGLAMVYGFARQSGGEIRIDSAPGAGTTVTLWLPAAVEEEAQVAAGSTDHAVLAGARVLVVEDEAPLRALVERVCRDAGMEVTAVADGDSAIALLRYGVRIDLLLSDIRMPGRLDGHGLAAEARALRPGLPIVLMTGYDDTAAEDVVVPILRKPFGRGALLDALAGNLRAGQHAPATSLEVK